ncbi:MAG: hypothetical protein V4612_01890 [Pseudomonadota bacterium]
MIKIICPQNIPSNITVSGVALCNALNQNGYEAIFYGLDNWHLDKCKTAPLYKFRVRKSDTIIVLGFPITSYDDLFCPNKKIRNLYITKRKTLVRVIRFQVKKFYSYLRGLYFRNFCGVKLIFSASEIADFDLAKIAKFYDKVHLSSAELVEKNIQNYFICPTIDGADLKIIPQPKSQKIAGIIGEICTYKGIDISINQALKDGAEQVIIYGFMQDPVYFYKQIEPIMKSSAGKIKLAGFVQDYQEIFDRISDVYFYPTQKVVSDLPRYCQMASVNFHGNQNVLKMQHANESEIIKIWTKELGLENGK